MQITRERWIGVCGKKVARSIKNIRTEKACFENENVYLEDWINIFFLSVSIITSSIAPVLVNLHPDKVKRFFLNLTCFSQNLINLLYVFEPWKYLDRALISWNYLMKVTNPKRSKLNIVNDHHKMKYFVHKIKMF